MRFHDVAKHNVTDAVIDAYERKIVSLEQDKLIAVENLQSDTRQKHGFEELFELALAFIANPYKLWTSGDLEHKRTVAKLAFSERIVYQRGKGL